MRIAICFFGITRNLDKKTLRGMERHLFGPVRKLDPAFVRFGHFNLVEKILNPRSCEIDIPLKSDDHLQLGCDHCLTTPQSEVDQFTDTSYFEAFGDPWNDGFASMKNLLRQYFSLNRVTELLIKNGTHFDLVIYTRPDVLFCKKLNWDIRNPPHE